MSVEYSFCTLLLTRLLTPSALSAEHFFRGDHRVAVNRDCVFEIQGVAAGECDHHGDALGLGDSEHESISLLQSLNRQRQSAELIFAIRIGSGEVTDEFRLELAQSQTERVAEARQIFGVADPVGQIQVKRRRGLEHRVVVLLMERDGEDILGVDAARPRPGGAGRAMWSRRIEHRSRASRVADRWERAGRKKSRPCHCLDGRRNRRSSRCESCRHAACSGWRWPRR